MSEAKTKVGRFEQESLVRQEGTDQQGIKESATKSQGVRPEDCTKCLAYEADTGEFPAWCKTHLVTLCNDIPCEQFVPATQAHDRTE